SPTCKKRYYCRSCALIRTRHGRIRRYSYAGRKPSRQDRHHAACNILSCRQRRMVQGACHGAAADHTLSGFSLSCEQIQQAAYLMGLSVVLKKKAGAFSLDVSWEIDN